MGLFHKKVCENLNKRNQAMYDIDNQEDTQTDALLIYAPKKAKLSSVEAMYSESVNKEAYKTKLSKKWLFIGFILVCGIIAFIITTVLGVF